MHAHYEVNHDWKVIWHLKVPERVKSFVWLMKHDRLLTNLNKSKRGLGTAACSLCGHANESTLHAFRDCPRVMEVWMHKMPLDISHEFFNLDLEEWFTLNINWSSKKEGGWNYFWTMACHLIWYWPNKEEHMEDFVRPCNPSMHVSLRLKDYGEVLTMNNRVVGRTK